MNSVIDTVSYRYELAFLQERMKQRAAESEALERKMGELMAMKAQLNVADEDGDKANEQLRHEVRNTILEEETILMLFLLV